LPRCRLDRRSQSSLPEASTFFSSEQSAKGLFPLGRELLRDNAIIATLYMALGAVVGFGFHIGLPWSDVVVIIACTIIAIWLAPRWLRQKIIWQKAALPYLSRLADMEPTMGQEAAKMLQELLDKGAAEIKPAQVIIGGPVGSDALSSRPASARNSRSRT
jgi:hypothetical protein